MEPNEHGHAVLCPWCSSVPVSILLKYWQVVDLRFSIIWLEDTVENNLLYTLLDEVNTCADVKQGVYANVLLGFGLNII